MDKLIGLFLLTVALILLNISTNEVSHVQRESFTNNCFNFFTYS